MNLNREILIPEAEVQKTAMAVLAALGVRCWRRNVGGRAWTDKNGKTRLMKFGIAGMSDLWGVGPDGRHWEVEIKRAGKRPSLEQLIWLQDMTAFGCVAFWADNTATLERVARAVIHGCRIEWQTDGSYDVV